MPPGRSRAPVPAPVAELVRTFRDDILPSEALKGSDAVRRIVGMSSPVFPVKPAA